MVRIGTISFMAQTSFRGPSAAREPGIHIRESKNAALSRKRFDIWDYGFRARTLAAPRNDEVMRRAPSRRCSGGVKLGRIGHRLDDFHIAGAAADVAAECFADFVFARTRVAPQQTGRRHDESRRAVAALGAQFFVEP